MAVTHPLPRVTPPSLLARWTPEVEAQLRSLALAEDSLLARMSAYHMGWVDLDGRPADAGGKHVRSNLCCWASAACGGSVRAALSAACALELVHSFTLVHDDVQDRDRLRRGRPAVWTVWGEAQAINAGDGIFALAWRALLADDAAAGPEGWRRSREATAALLDAVIEVIHGQCLDLEYECAPDTPLETYLRIAELKTGALLGASLELGAIVAGASPKERAAMRRAGRLLGLAFQVRDDWLGAWGTTARTGKDGHGDLVRRKLTYPVAAAYARASERDRAELVSLFRERGPEGEPRIRALLDRAGAAVATESAAVQYAAEAVHQISQCDLGPVREREFGNVADYVSSRSN